MSTTRDAITEAAVGKAHDPKLGRWLVLWIGVTVVGFAALALVVLMGYFRDQDQGAAITTLAAEQREAVRVGETLADQLRDLGQVPRADVPAPIDEVDPDDPEIQDAEIQDPERQDAETQDPEVQDPDHDDADPNDLEIQDGEIDDPEIQNEEINDPDPDDPETQDPEIDDPDPNDPDPNDEGPVCPPGSERKARTYDPNPLITGDEETWYVCVGTA